MVTYNEPESAVAACARVRTFTFIHQTVTILMKKFQCVNQLNALDIGDGNILQVVKADFGSTKQTEATASDSSNAGKFIEDLERRLIIEQYLPHESEDDKYPLVIVANAFDGSVFDQDDSVIEELEVI